MFAYGNPKTQKKWLGWNEEIPYVAQIINYDFDRAEFNKVHKYGYTDYKFANSTGSRGVYKYYFVEDGIYEIQERISWKKFEHYFVLIKDGKKTKLDFEEVLNCLIKNISD